MMTDSGDGPADGSTGSEIYFPSGGQIRPIAARADSSLPARRDPMAAATTLGQGFANVQVVNADTGFLAGC